MKFSKKEIFRTAKNIGLIIFGTIVLSFGVGIFILPMNIVSGGIPGLAIVLKFLLPFEFITVDLLVFVLTWGLFFMGLIVLGRAFAIKTLISTIVYPPAVSLFLRLVDPEVFGGFFYLAGNEYADLAVIISACMGGVFVGLGCALTFMGGGSTGGLDIIAFSFCKFFPRLKSSVIIFAIDATVVILGIFTIKNLIILLLGILSAFLAATMIDKVFIGGRSAFVAHIITEKHEEINSEIISRLNRTTTSMKVSGGFSHEGKTMLMISFSMSQYAEMLAIVSKHDPRAFVMIHRAHAINGEGWDKLG